MNSKIYRYCRDNRMCPSCKTKLEEGYKRIYCPRCHERRQEASRRYDAKRRQDTKYSNALETGIDGLIVAIILKAVEDYVKGHKKKDKKMIEEVERFFYSDWFRVLVDIEPEMFIDGIKDKYHLS